MKYVLRVFGLVVMAATSMFLRVLGLILMAVAALYVVSGGLIILTTIGGLMFVGILVRAACRQA